MKNSINEQFGGIDIYLFDQLAKGRFDNCKTVLDVGCGKGRNIVFLNRNGVEVHGIDHSVEAIELCKSNLKNILSDNLLIAEADNIPFETGKFDCVICSAVLHFAKDDTHFESMIKEIWRVLSNGGILFVRLASSVGIETLIKPLGNNCFELPDGSTRYLVDKAKLLLVTDQLGGVLLDPIKTTNVQDLRCMTTWVVQKK